MEGFSKCIPTFKNSYFTNGRQQQTESFTIYKTSFKTLDFLRFVENSNTFIDNCAPFVKN